MVTINKLLKGDFEFPPPLKKIKPVQPLHLHIYKRIRGRSKYYRCAHPDCSHYNHKDLLLDKRAMCPYCGQSYILNWQSLRLAVPHCENCTKGKKRIDVSLIEQNLKAILLEGKI